MSLASKLEALKETYENKNATLRVLFEQRLDTLRNNIIDFIGNALHDETANVLNQSDATRSFVVDRILEVVSDNLESEKETTIFKLIKSVNQLTQKCDTLTLENKQLHQDNQAFMSTQKTIDDNTDELNKLAQSVQEKELKIKSQGDKIKSIEDELRIKSHEFDRQQTQNDQQHEQIQKLHGKLENTLKTLQEQQVKYDQHAAENKQLKSENERNKHELKKTHKQIESLRAGLMKSESERLVLRKQYMDIGGKLESLTKDQNNQRRQYEKEIKEKDAAIQLVKNKLQQTLIENESLKAKLQRQSHSLSKKMKQELGKAKVLCDDVAILRKQLESERNISKMYVDELQKLKMELSQKTMEISKNEKHWNDKISSQKKKMHKYYQKMVDSNMIQLRDGYESHIKEMKEQYEETLRNIQNFEQEKYVEEQSKLLLKLKETEQAYTEHKEKYNNTENEVKDWMEKLEEYKSKQDGLQKEVEKYQAENEKLRDDLTLKDNEIKQLHSKQNEEKESFQRIIRDRQKQNENLSNMVGKLRREKDTIQQSKYEDSSKANATVYDLKQNIEQLTSNIKHLQKKNESMKVSIEQQNSSQQYNEKVNWKYQQKLSLIREFCRNIRREIRNNKNEIEYIKSSVAMYMERIFHQLQVSFNDIQTKSAKHILKAESGMKQELTKSMRELSQFQNLKLQSMEQKMKVIEQEHKEQLENTNLMNDKRLSMKDLDITQLQDEVDIIKSDLAQAKNVLSPKKFEFKKISMPSSINSSMILTSNKPSPIKKKKLLKKPKTYLSRRESYDTATIRRLRNDLQSLESNYRFSKRQIKKQFNRDDDDDSISFHATI